MKSKLIKVTKKIKASGFTLVEIMITVAILGILTSIALPSYNNYVTRAKLEEGLHFLERAKLAVNIFHQDGGDISTLNNATATYTTLEIQQSINSKYINQYWISPWGGNDITIWVKTNSASDLPINAQGKWPVYYVGNIQNREIKWTCKSDYHGATLKKYAPPQCR